MHKILAWGVWFGDEIMRRIVYLAGFFVLVSGAMSWIATYYTPVAQYGWSAVVFAGIGIACAITLVISGALVAWRYFNPLPKPLAPKEDKGLDFVKNILIYTNSPDAPAMFSGIAAGAFDRVTLFLDYSAYYTALSSAGWTQCRRIKLASFDPFEKGMRYEAIVVSWTVDTDGKIIALRWGNDRNKDIIVGTNKYRARLVFSMPGKEQYCYFMLVSTCMPDGRKNVVILNKNDWSFQQEWEET